MTERTADYYIKRFANLRIDKSHGRHAHHKPILLLSIIELIERDYFDNKEEIDKDLRERISPTSISL